MTRYRFTSRRIGFCLVGLTLLAVIVAYIPIWAQIQHASPTKSAHDVVERFCSLDAKGTRLTAEGRNRISDMSLSPDTWAPERNIVVLQKYAVHARQPSKSTADFDVEYYIWGKLNSSLRFERVEGNAVGLPVISRETVDFELTGKHNQFNGERMISVVGPVRWRIRVLPSSPHINLEAAIQYVTQMRDKSADSILQANANETLIVLRQIEKTSSNALSLSYQTSPKGVLKKFCDLDFRGEQLSKSRAISELFSANDLQEGPISVVKSCVVSDALISGNKATVLAEYEYVGALDRSTARFKRSPASGMKVRADFNLTLISMPDSGSTHAAKTAAWKIDGSIPSPHLSVESAIRYLNELRVKSSDASLRKNVDETLSVLKSSF